MFLDTFEEVRINFQRTALALLFAVLEARPSPFWVLDEVGSALDDANIDSSLAMLDGFRATTQSIVATLSNVSMPLDLTENPASQ